MNYMVFYLFSILFAVSDVLYGGELLRTVEMRKVAVLDILAHQASYLSATGLGRLTQLFAHENQYTCAWFDKHKEKIAASVSGEIKIMGSRRWGINHLLSDINAVVVTNEKDHEKIVDQLSQWYGIYYPNIKQFRTKTQTGLSLFVLKDFVDAELGEMKLEYTIQTPQINKAIIDGMTDRLGTQQDKTQYAFVMMVSACSDDVGEQLKLKESVFSQVNVLNE